VPHLNLNICNIKTGNSAKTSNQLKNVSVAFWTIFGNDRGIATIKTKINNKKKRERDLI